MDGGGWPWQSLGIGTEKFVGGFCCPCEGGRSSEGMKWVGRCRMLGTAVLRALWGQPPPSGGFQPSRPRAAHPSLQRSSCLSLQSPPREASQRCPCGGQPRQEAASLQSEHSPEQRAGEAQDSHIGQHSAYGSGLPGWPDCGPQEAEGEVQQDAWGASDKTCGAVERGQEQGTGQAWSPHQSSEAS